MNRSLVEISTRLLVIGLCLVVCAPLVALSFYNHPAVADDYCFADTARRFGFWTAQQMYYDGWTGRFIHNFLVHASPLTIGWYGGYKVYPIVLLMILVVGFYQLSRSCFPDLRPLGKLAIAAGLLLFFLSSLASLPEFMYWYAGMACYSLSCVFFLLLLAILIQHQRQGFRALSGYTLIEGLLIIGVVGSSETSMVMVVSVMAMLALGELILFRRWSVTSLILLGVTAVACYYLISAPGNAIRMGGNPNSSNVPATLTAATKYGLRYLIEQLLTTPLIPLTLLYTPLANRLLQQKPLPPYLRMPLWLALAYWLTTLLALISLHFYGVGIAPVPRLINMINLMLMLGWFYSVTLGLRAGQAYWNRFTWPVGGRSAVTGLALLWLVYAVATSSVVKLAYGDLFSKRAQQYDFAMNKRYRLMQAAAPGDTVRLEPLPIAPASLFLEDIRPDPQHLWNRCWAEYFNRKSVVLTTAN